ncbi:ribosomal RNA-processing protein 8 [Tanacetum coccineum]|uniref:Ribosomal RNA-processing protein 8 n=1 Tax=Tanacetum coccineum TaxID=301880 RepID=A0ABQ4XXD4_9ASTR
MEEWEEKKEEDRVSTTKIFHSKILINNSVCSLIIDGYSINNLVSRKMVDFLKLPMEICPIEGYQVCRVLVTIRKSYKIEVLCIMNDIDECHILLGRPWQCEVNGKYDLKKNLYLFSWEGRRIAMVPPKVTPQLPRPKVKVEEKITMVPPKVTPQLPKPEVKVEEKIVKAEVVDEHIEKIQDLQSYKQHDNKISTLLCETTNKVGILKTCKEIMGFNDDEDVKGFNYELKTNFKCVHDLNVRDLDSGLILRMIIKNHIKFSMVNKEAVFITTENLVVADKEHTTRCFGSWIDRWEYGRCIKKYKGFRVDVKRKSIEDKVRREKVFETLPEVRNNKVADAFQEEYELQCVEPLDEEAEQVTYVVQQTLCSPKSCKNLASKALVKDFKLSIEPRHSPYQIGWIKKGLALKVTKICKVPLAIGKHYNELIIFDDFDIEACHVLLERPWQHDMDATHQGKSNMYLFKWCGQTIDMLSLSVVSPKKKLESKTLATLVASPKYFQAERKETGVSYDLVMKGVKDVMENAIPPKGNRLCILKTSLRSQLIKEIHMGGLIVHLGRDKTIVSVASRFDWPQSKRDVGAFVKRYVVCQEGKDCDDGSRPEEQQIVVPCSDEEIVKFPTQPVTTEISRDNDSNLEDFLIVLTREEADIIRPIMESNDTILEILLMAIKEIWFSAGTTPEQVNSIQQLIAFSLITGTKILRYRYDLSYDYWLTWNLLAGNAFNFLHLLYALLLHEEMLKFRSSPKSTLQKELVGTRCTMNQEAGGQSRKRKRRNKRQKTDNSSTKQSANTTATVAAQPTLKNPPASVVSKSSSKPLSYLEKMKAKLAGGHFRMINEKLYTCSGDEALSYFKEDPSLFNMYHTGYQEQMSRWPEQPVNIIMKWLKDHSSSLVVADFGCGDARLSKGVKNKVFSIDLVSNDPSVIACDMSNTPLESSSVDVAVFCLSLMGTNFPNFIQEAHRVLKLNGWLLIAEVKSRLDPTNGGADPDRFIQAVCQLGFKSISKDFSNKMFILLYFRKKEKNNSKEIEWPELKPCLYKRR